MKQLSRLLTLLLLFIHLSSKAQSDMQQDRRVDPLLKQVDAKRPGLTMFSRKVDRDQYVNMAVLVDSTHTLTWFTCHGQAFDAVKLPNDVYSKIKSSDLNPFNYYKDYFFDLLSHVRDAAAQFRQKGQAVLKDTSGIYHRIYTYPPVQQAKSTLQKEVAIEKVMSDLCLRLSLFDSRAPQQLRPSDSFQLRFQLAGKMIREGDTTTYYNANPLSSASRIVLNKQAPGKMFVYDRQGQLADSVPLKAGKYTALLNEKEDVFLLYRGWLELQTQQAIAGKEEVTRLLNREHTMLYKPVYWEQNKQHLQCTLLEVQEQVDAIGSKVMGLIAPPQEEAAQLLATVYQDKPAEISYIQGLGFAYSVVYTRGNKRYELTDHRGNVMAVVSDRKNVVDENGDGSIDYYNADVVNAVDYLPFGGQMPGRTYSGDDKYRYGYNGKENDNEVKGEGNQQDYGMRIYDPRIGRFLSIDPLTQRYPWYTPYQFAGNTPIQATDLDGSEEYHYTLSFNKNGQTYLRLNNVEYYKEHSFLGFKWRTPIYAERAVVKYEGENYYIGFAGSYGRGNENGMELFNEFKKNPVAPLFPTMFLNEEQSYSVEDFSMAIHLQNNALMYGSLTEKAWYTRTLEDTKVSRIYRTQGGELPNASRSRISINSGGGIDIAGDEMLYVTVNDKAHQIYFYQKRGGVGKGAEIVSFEIPQSLADEIVANGIPQAQGKAYPNKPQISDPTKSKSAYGLPKEYIQKLRQQAIKGSGKTETP